MHENNGIYSIDADKSFEPPAENILASYVRRFVCVFDFDTEANISI